MPRLCFVREKSGDARVSQVYLFQLASQRAHWLSARQALIADNVANASTPGFQARDLLPFSAILDHTQISMATTDPAHVSATAAEFDPLRSTEAEASDVTLSGNSVNLEREMIKLGDVSHQYSMATGITRLFHQMMMTSLK
jgi:flagellar basal-body rod protein FlgB